MRVETKSKVREVNYDYLRAFAMIMVILNLVADYYLQIYSGTGWENPFPVYIFEGISHCAVPLF